jgi:hypothetical protein
MKNCAFIFAVFIAASLFGGCSSASDNSTPYYPGSFPDTTITKGVETDYSLISLKTTRQIDRYLSVAVTCWSSDSIEYEHVMHSWTGYSCEIRGDSLVFEYNLVCGNGLTGGVSSKKTLTYVLDPSKEMAISKIVACDYLGRSLVIKKKVNR